MDCCDACGEEADAWIQTQAAATGRSIGISGLFWGLGDGEIDCADECEELGYGGSNPRLDTVMYFERDGLEQIGTGIRAALGVGDDSDVLSSVCSDDCGEDVDDRSEHEGIGGSGARGVARNKDIDQDSAGIEREVCVKQKQDEENVKEETEAAGGFRRAAAFRRRRYDEGGEMPRNSVLFLTITMVSALFCIMFWRQLGFHGGHHSHCRPISHTPPLSIALLGHYCGPSNGGEFDQEPRDMLDTVCAQHDYCIERSRYNVGGVARSLYPVGESTIEGFRRCGIPLRSHTHPAYGCQIKQCDSEMLESLDSGIFACSLDPGTPKSRWCASRVGRRVCPFGAGYPRCLVALIFARFYHHWKVSTACRVMRMDAGAVQRDNDSLEWNCSCSTET